MIKSLGTVGTLGPSYLTQESDFFGKPLSKPSSESSCSADDCMRFLGDGEALCLPGTSYALPPATDALPQQNKVLSKQNRELWEENQKLANELAKLRAQGSAVQQNVDGDQNESLHIDHPLLYDLLEKQKARARPLNTSETIATLARGSREHVLSLGPHGIRHAAVQILLFTFALKNESQQFPGQPLRLVFNQSGPHQSRFQRAKQWIAPLNIADISFQDKAQALVDKHLNFDQPIEPPSDYDCTILSQAMMRYPEIKETCLFESDLVEKQSNPLGQLTSCIF